MALRDAVMVALAGGESTGYELSKRFDHSVANFWPASRQQIYRELDRLEADGLATARRVRQQKRPDKRVHFEFLDNSVPFGERPRTVAYGWNDRIAILDERVLVDVERFRRVNIEARSPQELWTDPAALVHERNRAFLDRCTTELAHVQRGPLEVPAEERRHLVGSC